MLTFKKSFRAAFLITFLLMTINITVYAEISQETKTPQSKVVVATGKAKPSLDDLLGKSAKNTKSPSDSKTQSASAMSSTGGDSTLAAPLQQQFHFDSFSGAGVFAFPISAPAGRGGMQPSLGVSYSPRQGNSLVGVGWDLSIGYIERSTKYGIPKYDSTDEFVANVGGSSMELVKISSTEYRAKNEGAFMKFIFDGSRWTVTDRSGTTYYFGMDDVLADSSRLKDTSNNVFRWYLSEVKDLNGNYMLTKYDADGGFEIIYTGEPGTDRAGFNVSSQKCAYRVKTVLSSSVRPDVINSYKSTFEYKIQKLVNEIDVYGAGSLMRKYVFEYELSQKTGRNLLKRI
ncbi:MAG: hypothetical protein HQL26_07545, partial [Candidatus Omnitrophica bacterium]|nr:hypothetical protein [Candidatus Omnitrophota bacterium]